MNIRKDWWILRENANSTALHRKNLSLTSSQQLLTTNKPKTNS